MSDDAVLRLVVGVDFTPAGDHALDEAIRYARRLDRDELHAVFVITEERRRKLAAIDRALTDAHDRLRRRVIERCAALGKRWEQEVIFHVRIGDPAEAIHQVAVDVDADLVVVGTHARRGLAKMLLGSVAQELVLKAHVPVLVARPKELSHLPRTPVPEPGDPSAMMHEPRVMASERLVFTRRDNHIAGLA